MLSTRLGYRKIGPQTKRRKFHPEQLIRNAWNQLRSNLEKV